MVDDTLLVPGESTLSRTHDIEPIPIQLPLEARTSRSAVLRIGAFAGFGGITCLFAAVALATWGMDEANHVNRVVLLLTCIACLVAAWCFLPTAIACTAELLHPSAPLIVGREGLSEGRTGVFVPWRSVVSVRPMVTRGGTAAVHLVLEAPVHVRRDPFRAGPRGSLWRRKPDELHVPLVALDVDARLLARSVIELVRRSGGAVEPARASM